MTDGEIGHYVGAAASLVCRWRNGERTLKKAGDAHTIKRLAVFFIEQAAVKRQRPQLAAILSIDEAGVDAGNEACIKALVRFLFDGHPIKETDTGKTAPAAARSITDNFIGVQGVTDALSLLEERLGNSTGTEISVYLSLEYSRLFQDEAASGIWELVYRMNHSQPVRVVFDGWLDNTERVIENLKALLPFIRNGRIQLHMIKSTQKFFYHNVTFFARDRGMVITAEPAGGVGVSISLLTESAGYISGMGAIYANFDRISKSLARQIGGTKDEAVYYGRLYEPPEDLQVLSGGVNLLYMDDESYLALLRLNGIKGSQRQYRHTKFIEDKRRYEAFLEGSRAREIVSMQALDRMIAESKIETPDFSFHNGEVRANAAILGNLLTGLLKYTERYKNLSLFLERGAGPQQNFICRIKGDSFILLHTWENGRINTVFSDNWMLVYEHIKQFNEALQSDQLVNIKDTVKTALQIRLERLGGKL